MTSSTYGLHKCRALLRSAVRFAHTTQPPLLSRFQRCSFTSPYMAAIWVCISLESGEWLTKWVRTQTRRRRQQDIRIRSTYCQIKVWLLVELVSEVPATRGKEWCRFSKRVQQDELKEKFWLGHIARPVEDALGAFITNRVHLFMYRLECMCVTRVTIDGRWQISEAREEWHEYLWNQSSFVLPLFLADEIIFIVIVPYDEI